MENKTDNLAHHGVPGQKWGIRRYQRKDGSLTPAGRKRANKLKDEYTSLTGKKLVRRPNNKNGKKSQNGEDKKKRIRDMSDDELKQKIIRLENEKRLATLQGETATKGKKFVSTVGKQVIAPAAIESGKRLLTDVFMKVGKKQLGLDAEDAFTVLQKEAKTSRLKRQIEDDKDWFAKRERDQKAQKEREKEQKKQAKK